MNGAGARPTGLVTVDGASSVVEGRAESSSVAHPAAMSTPTAMSDRRNRHRDGDVRCIPATIAVTV